MPYPLLTSYLAQLPAIEAARSLRDVNVMAVAVGRVEKGAARKQVATWRRLSGDRPRAKLASPQDLRAFGIGVTVT